MERRVTSWLVASAAFIFFYISLSALFGPPPREAPRREAEPEVPEVADAVPVPEVGPLDDPDEPPPPPRPTEPEWRTLGSMDPTSGHEMLAYFNTRGGAVERLELTERKRNGRLKYRRVDIRSGYLGYLALTPDEVGEGARVNVVGPGTPAARARSLDGGADGLRAGDVLVAVGGHAVQSPAHLLQLLSRTEPGDRLTLEVIRSAGAADREAEAGAADGEAEVEIIAEEEVEAGQEDEAGQEEEAADEAAGQVAPGQVAPREAELWAGPQRARLQFEAELSEHPLDLIRLTETGGDEEVAGNLSRLSCLLTLSQVNRRQVPVGVREISGLPSQHGALWDVDAVEEAADDADAPPRQGLEFRLPLSAAAMREAGGSGPVDLVRRYWVTPDRYTIDMEIEIVNRAPEPQTLAYRLDGPNGLTLEGWWYSTKTSPNWFEGAGARDIVYNTRFAYHQLVSASALLKAVRNQPENPEKVLFAPGGREDQRSLHYMGVDTQYFNVSYLPPEGEATMEQFARGAALLVADPDRLPRHKEMATNTSFYLDTQPVVVDPGQSLHHHLRMFAGPKQPDELAAHGLSATIEYGWFWWVAIPLSWILHGFYALVGNYAIAIIMLTVIVRLAMFPLGRKAALQAQKMQEIAPELKKITEKYKDDMEKRLKAQRELQQRVGFNPLSGCLPMFLQLPIFIGLYRALSVDIELRQAALSSGLQWSSNLAAPDMLYYWGDWLWEYLSGRGTGWLGPYFNILPVLVVGLFLVQQKLFMPPATDEQTAMTQKVMTIMTIMMGLFFFRFPSGLCIYFITSSLWGIAERKLVKKTLPPAPVPPAGGAKEAAAAPDRRPARSESAAGAGKEASKGGGSFVDRLRAAAGQAAEPPAAPPGKRRRPPVKKKK